MTDQSQIILVTGANGQLGRELQALAKDFPQYQFKFTSVNDLDITDYIGVYSFFREHKVQHTPM